MGQDHMELLRTLLFMKIIKVRILDNNFYNTLRSTVDL
ncbi:hypothetical protein PAECIP111802_07371 [Paenibacillus allorhizosphaerae]|uniref:Uncharacterized protein n=1 Tax=Paenibacillus allorhizosphaerae TaxID=2849866 RepID=A0ABN7TX95_9BACL|nr:hypothetical protein PAECIP111802_07371 [Paenibacillus allorhizosphaerae]